MVHLKNWAIFGSVDIKCYFHFNSLQAFVKSGRIEDGVPYMEKAIEVDCSCVQAYDTLAACEIQRYNNYDMVVTKICAGGQGHS